MKKIFLVLMFLALTSVCFAEEPCNEKDLKIKYNQERISEIQTELIQLQGWANCLINEREKLFQSNQQLRQPEKEK